VRHQAFNSFRKVNVVNIGVNIAYRADHCKLLKTKMRVNMVNMVNVVKLCKTYLDHERHKNNQVAAARIFPSS